MRQKPDCARCRALAAAGLRRCVVEIAVDIEHMNILSRCAHQRLRRSDHDTAIAPYQQRNLAWLSQQRLNSIANALPGDTRGGPTPYGRNRMMRKIARNRDVAIINRLAADRLQARHKLYLPIGLGIIFIAGQQRART